MDKSMKRRITKQTPVRHNRTLPKSCTSEKRKWNNGDVMEQITRNSTMWIAKRQRVIDADGNANWMMRRKWFYGGNSYGNQTKGQTKRREFQDDIYNVKKEDWRWAGCMKYANTAKKMSDKPQWPRHRKNYATRIRTITRMDKLWKHNIKRLTHLPKRRRIECSAGNQIQKINNVQPNQIFRRCVRVCARVVCLCLCICVWFAVRNAVHAKWWEWLCICVYVCLCLCLSSRDCSCYMP